jgi:hypothetical protein
MTRVPQAVVEATAAHDSDSDSDGSECLDPNELISRVNQEAGLEVAQLQALLLDNGAFFVACEEAMASAAAPASPGQFKLQSAEELRTAMNHICDRCQIERVDEDEAQELYDEPMEASVFYETAREYFRSLVRMLTMTA